MFSLKTLQVGNDPVACIDILGRSYPIQASAERLGGVELPASIYEVFADWERYFPMLEKLAKDIELCSDLAITEDAKTLPPLMYPGKILCAGANYYDHLEEMGFPAEKKDQRLFFFFKPSRQAAVGHGASVPIPAGCKKYDWEVELALVIGKKARSISLETALDYVAGYTVAIDLSARDFARAPDQFYKFDWVAGKAHDASCPLGPAIIPSCFISDPQDLRMRLWVNDDLKQDARTSGMIFDIREQLVRLTEIMTLEPGDIVLTGTPAGVGAAAGKFLQAGDIVTAEIETLGRLSVDITQPG